MGRREKKETQLSSEARLQRCNNLYAWHKDVLYRLALDGIGGDREMALDILEKTFAIAFQYVEILPEPQADRAKAFMVAILKGVLNQVYREARERAGIPSAFDKIYITERDQIDVDQVLIRNEMVTDLAEYVERLTFREKELIFYKYFIGWSDKEIAHLAKITEPEAESCIFQIKKKISKMMLGER